MMSAVALQMSGVAGLLATSILAIALSRSGRATAIIYGATCVICAAALFGQALPLVLNLTLDVDRTAITATLQSLDEGGNADRPRP